ncbi:hypothetical protein [Puia dinghuensis]|uniref:Uncharacterized protein n=1 Tax=Puia dinghuensis TaxID=1792502 RepID=A0A8J2XTV4_9BACT|nr:hypothetical protein [Puia dinghuensis]GGB06502.1 hypothetical protein GCM10011511_32430 [Puia dinghuensis]
MPIRHLPLYVIALYLLVSCKKNNGANSSGNANKLKMYIEDAKTSNSHVTDSFNVTYDNDNRITSLASPALKFVYTYSSKSFTLDLFENNQLSIHEIFYINSASYVDSTFQFDNTNDTTTEKYIYTGSLLTRDTTYSYSSAGTSIDTRDDYTYDNNGNTIKDVQSDGQGNINQITTFTYTTYPLSVRTNPTYFAPGAKYLPATQKVTDGAGSPIGTITYSYAFDGAGRLTKETDSADNGDVVVKTYIYY